MTYHKNIPSDGVPASGSRRSRAAVGQLHEAATLAELKDPRGALAGVFRARQAAGQAAVRNFIKQRRLGRCCGPDNQGPGNQVFGQRLSEGPRENISVALILSVQAIANPLHVYQPLPSKTRFQHKKADGKFKGLELSKLCQYFSLEPDFQRGL